MRLTLPPGTPRPIATMLREANRTIDKALVEHNPTKIFVLVSGGNDSMVLLHAVGTRAGAQVWVNPLLRWTNEEMVRYRQVKGVPTSEVAANLHMSGECLCGAFAKPGEKEMIRLFYPTVAARLDDLERRAEGAGLPACVWGVRPPSKSGARAVPNAVAAQAVIDAADRAQRGALQADPMCSSCTAGVAEFVEQFEATA